MTGNIVTVDLLGDKLLAFQDGETVYVAPKQISDFLGLAWRAQQRRLQRDPILAEGVTIMVTALVGNGQEMTWLRLDLVNGWLFGIDEKRVAPEHREKVLEYKRRCYRVLHDHFFAPRAVEPPMLIDAKIRMVNAAFRAWGRRGAQRVWIELGLPAVVGVTIEAEQRGLFNDDDGPIESTEVH